jgi:hypothetical protein
MTKEMVPDSIMKIYDNAGSIITSESEVKHVLINILKESANNKMNFSSDAACQYVADQIIKKLKVNQ